jgi:hypothetical protein
MQGRLPADPFVRPELDPDLLPLENVIANSDDPLRAAEGVSGGGLPRQTESMGTSCRMRNAKAGAPADSASGLKTVRSKEENVKSSLRKGHTELMGGGTHTERWRKSDEEICDMHNGCRVRDAAFARRHNTKSGSRYVLRITCITSLHVLSLTRVLRRADQTKEAAR